MMDVDPLLVKQTAPGIFGAVGAVFFMKGPWPVRLGMIVPGGAASFWGSPYLAHQFAMSEGLAGFLIGLFGMAVVAKLFNTWDRLELTEWIQGWLPKRNREGQ